MPGDPLENLLQQVDANAARAAGPIADLPVRVRRLAARRQRRVRAVGSIAAAAFAVGMALVLDVPKEGTGPSPAPTVDVSQELAEIARLREEADMRLEIVRRTLAVERARSRLADLDRLPAVPDPVRVVRAEVEETAATLLYRADTLYRTPALRSSAVQGYRRAIELFPTTQSARLARARLAAIGLNQGES